MHYVDYIFIHLKTAIISNHSINILAYEIINIKWAWE